MSSRDAYVQRMKARLDEWNADIDKLSAKAEVAEADAKIAYLAQVENLRAKHAEARRELDKLGAAGEGAWEDLRAGVETAWEAIGNATKEALSRFK